MREAYSLLALQSPDVVLSCHGRPKTYFRRVLWLLVFFHVEDCLA